ncbi:MAG: hydrogenase nickel incorporation protein HypB [Candidatus Thermoplasmatota archaeon]|nr:hydrogenase nickel incorporation protein HypB [Euryarchaeota archaeon]MBU4032258.1 hydrogenase nickel incorporation protein HypB [Candidatus Thermoplasmatota archaeon]MBU4071133.1 hydrogenase nickel incorporation protein HypB [Candidatus Thermoplasmatota archaeon]MBU4143704.1 hydrogenase nickel incorporation protein HypB [Candidatus Thermoplasmatota archaeon]MBU4591782.1 hydrogenase nickel incorporation protein HypB [Candidatus Thermoplasmatota archaeon]
MHKVCDVELGADMLAANRRIAEDNAALLERHGIRSFDFLGAIGSGKTLLIEKLADILMNKGLRCAAIAGDVAGDDDYRRFRSHGMPVVNINTGKECHLDAHMVDHALEKMDLEKIDVLFIENVGNLVCPADFPLGSKTRITIVSVTEGDDMIRKHPVLMGGSDIIVVNKIGMAQAMEVDVKILKADVHAINPHIPVVMTDARQCIGLDNLLKEMGL